MAIFVASFFIVMFSSIKGFMGFRYVFVYSFTISFHILQTSKHMLVTPTNKAVMALSSFQEQTLRGAIKPK